MAAPGPTGLSTLRERYDVLLCDVWGVVHNGVAAHQSAVDALVRYKEAGGVVILITNAPRAAAPIVAMLDRLGVPAAAYDSLVSSGDVTRSMIAPYRGRVIHHVGPATWDDSLYEGLGVVRGPAEGAEAVVVTDLDDDDDTIDMYETRMALWRERNLPLICANPDKVVEHGGRIVLCGGALADAYAERGGEVLMAGKPHPPIYEEAQARAEAAGAASDLSRMLAIGDSVRTDAAGAAAIGVDLLFITGSIHAAELGSASDEAVHALVAPSGARLVGHMPQLQW